MKAIGYLKSLPIEHPESLFEAEIPKPVPGSKDLLIRVAAVSVNPVDTKVRIRRASENANPIILGWDAAGTVEALGRDVQGFKIGDRVYYAGDLTRAGSNSEYQTIDFRVVGHMPKSLGFPEAAALPLTSLTAWECLFDRLNVEKTNSAKSVLIIGGAGGVGSIAIQIAKTLTQLKVITTASNDKSTQWCKELGADLVVNHRESISTQIQSQGISQVDYVLSLTHTDQHMSEIAKIIKPQGKLCLIDDPQVLDINSLKTKSISIHWEMMFTRSMYQTDDINEQSHILNEVAKLVDQGKLRSTVKTVLKGLNANNFKNAHRQLESHQTLGKLVITY